MKRGEKHFKPFSHGQDHAYGFRSSGFQDWRHRKSSRDHRCFGRHDRERWKECNMRAEESISHDRPQDENVPQHDENERQVSPWYDSPPRRCSFGSRSPKYRGHSRPDARERSGHGDRRQVVLSGEHVSPHFRHRREEADEDLRHEGESFVSVQRRPSSCDDQRQRRVRSFSRSRHGASNFHIPLHTICSPDHYHHENLEFSSGLPHHSPNPFSRNQSPRTPYKSSHPPFHDNCTEFPPSYNHNRSPPYRGRSSQVHRQPQKWSPIKVPEPGARGVNNQETVRKDSGGFKHQNPEHRRYQGGKHVLRRQQCESQADHQEASSVNRRKDSSSTRLLFSSQDKHGSPAQKGNRGRTSEMSRTGHLPTKDRAHSSQSGNIICSSAADKAHLTLAEDSWSGSRLSSLCERSASTIHKETMPASSGQWKRTVILKGQKKDKKSDRRKKSLQECWDSVRPGSRKSVQTTETSEIADKGYKPTQEAAAETREVLQTCNTDDLEQEEVVYRQAEDSVPAAVSSSSLSWTTVSAHSNISCSSSSCVATGTLPQEQLDASQKMPDACDNSQEEVKGIVEADIQPTEVVDTNPVCELLKDCVISESDLPISAQTLSCNTKQGEVEMTDAKDFDKLSPETDELGLQTFSPTGLLRNDQVADSTECVSDMEDLLCTHQAGDTHTVIMEDTRKVLFRDQPGKSEITTSGLDSVPDTPENESGLQKQSIQETLDNSKLAEESKVTPTQPVLRSSEEPPADITIEAEAEIHQTYQPAVDPVSEDEEDIILPCLYSHGSSRPPYQPVSSPVSDTSEPAGDPTIPLAMSLPADMLKAPTGNSRSVSMTAEESTQAAHQPSYLTGVSPVLDHEDDLHLSISHGAAHSPYCPVLSPVSDADDGTEAAANTDQPHMLSDIAPYLEVRSTGDTSAEESLQSALAKSPPVPKTDGRPVLGDSSLTEQSLSNPHRPADVEDLQPCASGENATEDSSGDSFILDLSDFDTPGPAGDAVADRPYEERDQDHCKSGSASLDVNLAQARARRRGGSSALRYERDRNRFRPRWSAATLAQRRARQGLPVHNHRRDRSASGDRRQRSLSDSSTPDADRGRQLSTPDRPRRNVLSSDRARRVLDFTRSLSDTSPDALSQAPKSCGTSVPKSDDSAGSRSSGSRKLLRWDARSRRSTSSTATSEGKESVSAEDHTQEVKLEPCSSNLQQSKRQEILDLQWELFVKEANIASSSPLKKSEVHLTKDREVAAPSSSAPRSDLSAELYTALKSRWDSPVRETTPEDSSPLLKTAGNSQLGGSVAQTASEESDSDIQNILKLICSSSKKDKNVHPDFEQSKTEETSRLVSAPIRKSVIEVSTFCVQGKKDNKKKSSDKFDSSALSTLSEQGKREKYKKSLDKSDSGTLSTLCVQGKKDKSTISPDKTDFDPVTDRLLNLSGSVQSENPQDEIEKITKRLLTLTSALPDPAAKSPASSGASSVLSTPEKLPTYNTLLFQSAPLSSLSYSSATDTSPVTPRTRRRDRKRRDSDCHGRRSRDNSLSSSGSRDRGPFPSGRQNQGRRPVPPRREPIASRGHPLGRGALTFRPRQPLAGQRGQLHGPGISQRLTQRQLRTGHQFRPVFSRQTPFIRRQPFRRRPFFVRGQPVDRPLIPPKKRPFASEQEYPGQPLNRRLVNPKYSGGGTRVVRRVQAINQTRFSRRKCTSSDPNTRPEPARIRKAPPFDVSRVFPADSCTEKLIEEAVQLIHLLPGESPPTSRKKPSQGDTETTSQAKPHALSDNTGKPSTEISRRKSEEHPWTPSSLGTSQQASSDSCSPHIRKVFVRKQNPKTQGQENLKGPAENCQKISETAPGKEEKFENHPDVHNSGVFIQQDWERAKEGHTSNTPCTSSQGHEELVDPNNGSAHLGTHDVEVTEETHPNISTPGKRVDTNDNCVSGELFSKEKGCTPADEIDTDTGRDDSKARAPDIEHSSQDFRNTNQSERIQIQEQQALWKPLDTDNTNTVAGLVEQDFSLESLTLGCSDHEKSNTSQDRIVDCSPFSLRETQSNFNANETADSDQSEAEPLARFRSLSLETQEPRRTISDSCPESCATACQEHDQELTICTSQDIRSEETKPPHSPLLSPVKDYLQFAAPLFPLAPKGHSTSKDSPKKRTLQRSTSLSSEREKLKALFSVKRKTTKNLPERKTEIQTKKAGSALALLASDAALSGAPAAWRRSYSLGESPSGGFSSVVVSAHDACTVEASQNSEVNSSFKAAAAAAFKKSLSDSGSDLAGNVIDSTDKERNMESDVVDVPQTQPEVKAVRHKVLADKDGFQSVSKDEDHFIDDETILRDIDSCLDDTRPQVHMSYVEPTKLALPSEDPQQTKMVTDLTDSDIHSLVDNSQNSQTGAELSQEKHRPRVHTGGGSADVSNKKLVDYNQSTQSKSDKPQNAWQSTGMTPCKIITSHESGPVPHSPRRKNVEQVSEKLKLSPEKVQQFRSRLYRSGEFHMRTSTPKAVNTETTTDNGVQKEQPGETEIQISLNIDPDDVLNSAKRNIEKDLEVEHVRVSVTETETDGNASQAQYIVCDVRRAQEEDDSGLITASVSITLPKDHTVNFSLDSLDSGGQCTRDQVPLDNTVPQAVSHVSDIADKLEDDVAVTTDNQEDQMEVDSDESVHFSITGDQISNPSSPNVVGIQSVESKEETMEKAGLTWEDESEVPAFDAEDHSSVEVVSQDSCLPQVEDNVDVDSTMEIPGNEVGLGQSDIDELDEVIEHEQANQMVPEVKDSTDKDEVIETMVDNRNRDEPVEVEYGSKANVSERKCGEPSLVPDVLSVIHEAPDTTTATVETPPVCQGDFSGSALSTSTADEEGNVAKRSQSNTSLSPPKLEAHWERSSNSSSSFHRSLSLSPPHLEPEGAYIPSHSASHVAQLDETVSQDQSSHSVADNSSTGIVPSLPSDHIGGKTIACCNHNQCSELTSNFPHDKSSTVSDGSAWASSYESNISPDRKSSPQGDGVGGFRSSWEDGVYIGSASKMHLKKKELSTKKKYMYPESSLQALSSAQGEGADESSINMPVADDSQHVGQSRMDSDTDEDRLHLSGESSDELDDAPGFLGSSAFSGTKSPLLSPSCSRYSPDIATAEESSSTKPVSTVTSSFPEAPVSQQSTAFSLDSLLRDKKRNDAVEEEMKVMQANLREGILKGGIEALDVEDKADDERDDENFTAEQRNVLSRLQMEDRQIADCHPGEQVLRAELCGHLFTESVSPADCGFTNMRGSSLEHLLDSLEPAFLMDVLSSDIIAMTFHSLTSKEAVLRWLLYLASVHSDGLVVLKCEDQIQEVLHTQLEHITGDGPERHTWAPSIQDLFHLFVNWGAAQEDLCSQGVLGVQQFREMLPVADLPQIRQPIQIYKRNVQSVLQIVSACLQYRPPYSSQELTHLLLMICRVALDSSLCNASLGHELQVCTSSVLECYSASQWHSLVPSLCRQLSSLTDHHHNQVYLAQLFPATSQRCLYLRQRLAYLMLHNSLPRGSGDSSMADDIITNFQLKEVVSLVPRMRALLDSDLYHLSSLIYLLDICVGSAFMLLTQQKQLYELIEAVRYMVSDMRDNVRRLDLIRVKDVLVRMCSKWDLALKSSHIRQGKIFASYSSQDSPVKMETLQASSIDDDSDDDDDDESSCASDEDDEEDTMNFEGSTAESKSWIKRELLHAGESVTLDGGDSGDDAEQRTDSKCYPQKRAKTEVHEAERYERDSSGDQLHRFEDLEDDDEDSLPEL